MYRPRFRKRRKGIITQGFAASGLGYPHTGIDWTIGWHNLIPFDNPGCIYKLFQPQELDSNWTGIYQLVDMGGGEWMEVLMGHLAGLAVREGQWVRADDPAGVEGNFGEVYHRGERITPAMQDAGDRRGHHTHEQYRPAIETDVVVSNAHYLRNKDGSIARSPTTDRYLQVKYTNEQRGCVDPMIYRADTTLDLLEAYALTLENADHKDASKVRAIIRFIRSFL